MSESNDTRPTTGRPTGAHALRRMVGRDPHERGRAASSLELLFDLTFVVAFSVAGSEAAHLVAEGHYGPAIGGFVFAMFAIIWAWINFSWFASAFDTDDWFYRITTMVQMVGVVVLAIGLPPMFASLDHGDHIDNTVMIAGYVVMRVAMIAQWVRVAVASPAYRRNAVAYIVTLTVAQVGWVVLLLAHTGLWVTVAAFAVLYVVELGGPALAERTRSGTPWHPHHIAERYSLLAIITLGEGVVGTVATLGAAVSETGWSVDAAAVVAAGIALTFGMWWIYFVVPAGEQLEAHRDRAFGWGYGSFVIFASIAATGAGLHVAGYYLDHESHIGETAALTAVAVPVLLYIVAIFAMYHFLTRSPQWLYVGLLSGSFAIVGLAYVVASHASLWAALLMVAVTPFVTVVGYEWRGHRHVDAATGV